MSKASRSKKSSAPKIDPYLEGLMSKLMDRLTGLERKMDQVLSRVSGPGPRPQGPSAQPMQTSYSSPHPMVEPKNLPRHERRQMFEAVCADCKEPCEVPFRPTEGRAIYCKPCFAKRRAEGRVHPPQTNGALAPSAPPAASASKPEAKSSAKPAKAAKASKSAKPAKKAKKKK